MALRGTMLDVYPAIDALCSLRTPVALELTATIADAETPELAREFARALKDGTLSGSTGSKIAKSDPKILQQLMEEARRNATRSISIRVPIADLEHARQIAENTGVGYQTVLKKAIREGLKRSG